MAEGWLHDPRVRRYVTPKRVVWRSQGEGRVEHAERLLVPGPGQVGLEQGTACVLRHSGQPAGVLLDFGRELHGSVQIIVVPRASFSPKWGGQAF